MNDELLTVGKYYFSNCILEYANLHMPIDCWGKELKQFPFLPVHHVEKRPYPVLMLIFFSILSFVWQSADVEEIIGLNFFFCAGQHHLVLQFYILPLFVFSGLSIRLHMAISDVCWSQWTLFKAPVLQWSLSLGVPPSVRPLRCSGQSINTVQDQICCIVCEDADGMTTTWSIEVKSAVPRGED